MNTAKYTGWLSKNFPLSTESLDFIQQQILLTANACGGIAGGNYILTGCTVTGTVAASGIMVIGGELLPFIGGTVQSQIRITEVKQDITAGGVTYASAHTVRYVEFGSNVGNVDTYNWADFTAIPTLKYFFENYATTKQLEALQSLMLHKGMIVEWGLDITDIPAGFALCTGQTVNGVTTPNKCGRVTIGYDPASNSVPANITDKSENYGKAGNTGGKSQVQLTVDEMPSHDHQIYTENGNDGGGGDHELGGNLTGRNTAKSGGDKAHENRMPYIVGLFIMKVV